MRAGEKKEIPSDVKVLTPDEIEALGIVYTPAPPRIFPFREHTKPKYKNSKYSLPSRYGRD